MMRRFHLLFDSTDACREAVEVLSSEGIAQYHLHAIAGVENRLDGLPKATVWQRTELAKGILIGFLFGGIAGFCGGLLVLSFPPPGVELGSSALLLMSALGALFGILVNAMTKSRQHHRGLDRFRSDIEAGRILLLTDLPDDQAEFLLKQLAARCPGMQIRD